MIKCPLDVIDGYLITQKLRKKIFGDVAGGSGSMNPEKYQRNKIIEGTQIDCLKTNIRINLRNNCLEDIRCPNIQINGFDYTENFDGVQNINNALIYINLKCIVGKGGTQTRSLREVYWFIEGQLKILVDNEDIYFANILDGNEANANMSKYNYLISHFKDVKERIYVGDLKNYFNWLNNLNLNK